MVANTTTVLCVCLVKQWDYGPLQLLATLVVSAW